MQIIKQENPSNTKFNYIFDFAFNMSVVEFCRQIKEEYSIEEFSFDMVSKKWRFNNLEIVDKICKKYPKASVHANMYDDMILFEKVKAKEEKMSINYFNNLKDVSSVSGLRDYQKDALNSVINAIKDGIKGNYLLVLPTGSGKSILVSSIVHTLGKSVLILQPTKEILQQNYEKLLKYVDSKEIGIYSASMNKKVIKTFTFATIQSIYKKADFFKHFDLMILDECVIKDTFIACSQGYKKIQDIKKNEKVWTYNEKTKEIELKPVLKLIVKKRNKPLVKIEEMTCTNNHKIFIKNKNWQKAKNVNYSSRLVKINDLLENVNVDEILYGCLLGDSNVDKKFGRIKFGHCENQLSYLIWKRNILLKKYKIKNIRKMNNNKGYNKNGIMYRFNINNKKFAKKLHLELYSNKKRVLKKSVLNKLGKAGLAIWIQDDGCCIKNRINLGTYRYGKNENVKLLNWFKSKYGITGELRQDKRQKKQFQYFIIFNVENSLKLYSLIFPFLHGIKKNTFDGLSKKYFGEIRYCCLCGKRINHLLEIKPTHRGRIKYCNRSLCVKAYKRLNNKYYQGKSVEKLYSDLLKKYKEENETEFVYDLSIKDNHNYFADNILVHNCHLLNPSNLTGMFTSFINKINILRERDSKKPPIKIIGLTATPYRMASSYKFIKAKSTDPFSSNELIAYTTVKLINRMKGRFWNHILYNINIQELIDKGFLCPLEYIDKSLIEHEDIPLNKSESDFNLVKYEEILSKKQVKILKIISYAESVSKSVLVFCSSVKQAEILCSMTSGSEVVTAKTKADERDRIVKRFKDGKIKTVYNVGVFSLGFDHPALDCIVLIRPTRSIGLFYQMIGRGVRTAPGKTSCKVIDMTSTVKNIGRIETIELKKMNNWELLSEKGSWHNREIYHFKIK